MVKVLTLILVGLVLGVHSQGDTSKSFEKKLTSELVMQISLQISNRDSIQASLIRSAMKFGGYFQGYTDNSLELKVPRNYADTLKLVVLNSGKVLYKNFQISDFEAQILDISARLGAKRKLLKEYEKILQEAKQQAMVQVERSINQLVEEIESLQGEMNLIQQKITWTTLTVYFEFPFRPPPLSEGKTPFPWVNALGIPQLQEGFKHE